MLELIVNNDYKEPSTQEMVMSNFSMSHFATKEDFLRAKADLEQQEKEVLTASAKPGQMVVRRLITGVELKLVESGKHWTLGVKKV